MYCVDSPKEQKEAFRIETSKKGNHQVDQRPQKGMSRTRSKQRKIRVELPGYSRRDGNTHGSCELTRLNVLILSYRSWFVVATTMVGQGE